MNKDMEVEISKVVPNNSIPKDLPLHKVDQLIIYEMEPSIREQLLLEWTTQKLSSDQPRIDLEEGWNIILQFGVNILIKFIEKIRISKQHIYSRPFGTNGNKAWTSLYSISYNLCQPYGRILYERVKQSIVKYLIDLLNILNNKNGIYLLNEFNSIWSGLKILIKWKWILFMHLDRGLVKTNKLPTLTSAALNLYYDQMFLPCKSRIRNIILDELIKERGGNAIESNIIIDSIQIFLLMGRKNELHNVESIDNFLKDSTCVDTYTEEFEKYFLDSSRNLYSCISQEKIDNNDLTTYFNFLSELLKKEFILVGTYLINDTLNKLEKVFMEEFIIKHKKRIIEGLYDLIKEVYYLLLFNDSNIEDIKCQNLKKIVALLVHCNNINHDSTDDNNNNSFDMITSLSLCYHQVMDNIGDELANKKNINFEELIKSNNQQKIANFSSDSEFIVNSIKHYQCCASITSNFLMNNYLCKKEMRLVLIKFVNKSIGSTTYTEMLINYCDKVLKGSIKIPQQNLDKLLIDNCIQFFPLISNKDVFCELWRDFLSKRLLLKKSISTDLELQIIGKIKLESGGTLTDKLEGMLHDFSNASDMNNQFNSYINKENNNDMNQRQCLCNIQVLSTGHWPLIKYRDVKLPIQLENWKNLFTKWYLENFDNKRKLNWIYSHGEVSLSAKILNSNTLYEFSLTTIQSVVLLLFNEKNESLSFDQIFQLSGISEDLCLKRVLHSLSCHKDEKKGISHTILIKNSISNKILNTDSFQINLNFKSKFKKIYLPNISLGLDKENVMKSVNEDRCFIIEASIVRIMKSRKIISHNDLISEILHQLSSFQPDISSIKKRIESLIERDYLKRDDDNTSMYVYIS
jgi:cullin 1